MSHIIRVDKLATERTYSFQILDKCSDLFKKCNFKDPREVENLQNSILGRLTSGYQETTLCDVLIFLDLHTILNLQILDSEAQARMISLLFRYFKQKHET